MVGTKNYFSDA